MIRKRNPQTDDRAIINLIRRELLPYARKAFPNLKLKRVQTLQRLKRGATFVSSYGWRKKPYGFVTCYAENGTLVIDMLAVSRILQGHGIGSVLLKRAEQWGIENDCLDSVLLVDQKNPRAYRFYERHGYRGVRSISYLQCDLMSKTLNAAGNVRCCAI